jgi:hypothetical protein
MLAKGFQFIYNHCYLVLPVVLHSSKFLSLVSIALKICWIWPHPL